MVLTINTGRTRANTLALLLRITCSGGLLFSLNALDLRSEVLFQHLLELLRDQIEILQHFVALPDGDRKAGADRTKEEIVLRVVMVRPGITRVFVLIEHKVHNPRLLVGQAALINLAVARASDTEPFKRVRVILGSRAQEHIVHLAHVPAHGYDAVMNVDRVLQRGHDKRRSAAVSHLVQCLAIALDIIDAMNSDTLVALAFLDGLTVLLAADAIDMSAHLSPRVEGVDEQTVLQPEQVVAEGRLEDLALCVVELTLTMHHAHLPAADVRVANHFLRLACLGETLRPVELADAVELPEVEVTTVLTAA